MTTNKPVLNEHGELIGWPIDPSARSRAPSMQVYRGQYFSLQPVDVIAHGDALFAAATMPADADRIWTYLPYGPFPDIEALTQHQLSCADSDDPLYFTVVDNLSENPVGMVSFLNIATTARSIELGHIWYVPLVQGSKANTEVCFLMLCEAFDNLNYRRVEWKCNALNLRSRAAAQRMGFSFEGVFRQHLIVKGHNRDTAWLAMLDHEWPEYKKNMASWLYPQASAERDCEPAFSLAELNRPLLYAVDPALATDKEKDI